MTERKDGSYSFDGLSAEEQAAEIERLSEQAQPAIASPERWRNAGLREDSVVVDLGSGAANFTKIFASIAVRGRVFAFDREEALLEKARQLGLPNVEARSCDFDSDPSLGLDENSVDFVYGRLIFEHLRFPENLLEKMFKVLRPGGQIKIDDHDWLHRKIYPSTPEWDRWREAAIRLVAQPDIGETLGLMMHRVGFRAVQAQKSVLLHRLPCNEAANDRLPYFLPEPQRTAALAALKELNETGAEQRRVLISNGAYWTGIKPD